jgi:hypothetical protein
MDTSRFIQNTLQTQSGVISSSTRARNMMLQSAMALLDDEERKKKKRRVGGSKPGRSANLPRDFEAGYRLLIKHYFSPTPLYPPLLFRRRFRMHRELFLSIVDDVTEYNSYFLLKKDALGRLGLNPIQKVTLAIRMLAYGGSADSNDKYIQISESTTLKSLLRFCDAIINIYGEEYLQYPNADNIKRLLAIGKAQGFPGMLGSLDCMHWEWKNCPTAWAGQFTGKEKVSRLYSFFLIHQMNTNLFHFFRRPPLYLKQSPPTTCGYGTHFLVFPAPTTTSLFSIILLYFQNY